MGAGSFSPFHFKGSGSIPAGQTVVVHDFPLDQFKSMSYFLTFFNDAQAKKKMMNISVINNSTLDSSVRGINVEGGGLDLEVSPLSVAGDMNLSIKNNEAFEVDLEFAFGPLG